MGVLGLHCCVRAFSRRGGWGLLSADGAWGSHCSGSSCCGAWARLACFKARGLCADRGLNLCPQHSEADSYPWSQQGRPCVFSNLLFQLIDADSGKNIGCHPPKKVFSVS